MTKENTPILGHAAFYPHERPTKFIERKLVLRKAVAKANKRKRKSL